MNADNEMTWPQAAGTFCVLISVPMGLFGALNFFSDLWGWVQIKMGWIPNPVEGPGLGIMIGLPFLVAAIVLFATGKSLIGNFPKKSP